MASTTFREGINSLGWTRRDTGSPVNTSSSLFSRLQSWNPFSGREGYLRLPTHESPGAPLPAPSRRDEEGSLFALSRWDRMLIFAGCNVGAAICFLLCFLLWPALTLKPRKFAILWSIGSVFFLASWAVLMGPMTYARHLLSGSRLPFTAAYFGSIALTLYFAVGLRSSLLTLPAAVCQLVALIWYLVSYFPMGSTGLQYMGRFGAQRMANWVTG